MIQRFQNYNSGQYHGKRFRKEKNSHPVRSSGKSINCGCGCFYGANTPVNTNQRKTDTAGTWYNKNREEESLRVLAGTRHDRKAYISRAREEIRVLEETLQEDKKEPDETRDMGWDTTTLRQDFKEERSKK